MSISIIVPAAGESVTEADIANWYKNDGDFVKRDEPIVALETEKATLDIAAEQDGILSIVIADGTVKVGDVIGKIAPGSAPAASAATAAASAAVAEPLSAPVATSTTGHYAQGHPSPAAAKALGSSPAPATGTGKDGRVTKQDALSHQAAPTTAAAPATPATAVVPVSTTGRHERREKMTRLRKTIMGRLVESQQSTASLTTFNEVDMSAVMALRSKYKDAFKEKHGVGLGFMSFFTKAACEALLSFPIMNAYLDGDEILFHDYCDVAIAVASPKGLVVPVIRDAQAMSLAQIESSILGYAKKAKEGKLTMDDMTGGTFTITNGGTFGSMLSTPILNRPQSAILGMHNIVKRPVAIDDKVEIRPIMYLAVTYDHRIIDGADAVQFLVKIKTLLEDPARLLLGV
jgi:2-oxoglutarate dehydrogenase E2 component (dihydrolipoamide succinyltransferase)